MGAAPVGSRDRAATLSFLTSSVTVAVGWRGRAATTTYVPVLLQQIADRPALIGLAMLDNALEGFVVPLVVRGAQIADLSRAALILAASRSPPQWAQRAATVTA